MFEEITYESLPALHTKTEAVALTLLPQWGGKIASLLDRRHQQEWLWRNPHLPYRLPTYANDYVGAFDVGGFDECFPNIGAGFHPQAPWQGTPLPDHGEVWALPWQVEAVADGVRLTVHGVRLPYRLEKTIRFVDEARIRLAYAAHNFTAFPMPVLWSSHPLFAVREGMTLQVPAAQMRVDNGENNFPASAGEEIPWPNYQGLDLSRVPDPVAGWAAKLYARRLEEGQITLSDPERGSAFHFRFDPQLVPQVGLWLNYGGWSGVTGADPYFNLAIEPCIGVADNLDVAMNAGGYLELPAHGTHAWWLELVLA